jgi:hypothetical protein
MDCLAVTGLMKSVGKRRLIFCEILIYSEELMQVEMPLEATEELFWCFWKES